MSIGQEKPEPFLTLTVTESTGTQVFAIHFLGNLFNYDYYFFGGSGNENAASTLIIWWKGAPDLRPGMVSIDLSSFRDAIALEGVPEWYHNAINSVIALELQLERLCGSVNASQNE